MCVCMRGREGVHVTLGGVTCAPLRVIASAPSRVTDGGLPRGRRASALGTCGVKGGHTAAESGRGEGRGRSGKGKWGGDSNREGERAGVCARRRQTDWTASGLRTHLHLGHAHRRICLRTRLHPGHAHMLASWARSQRRTKPNARVSEEREVTETRACA